MRALARVTGLSPSTVCRCLARLEALGYVGQVDRRHGCRQVLVPLGETRQ